MNQIVRSIHELITAIPDEIYHEVYAASSPIAESKAWTPSADGASQKSWFTSLSPMVRTLPRRAFFADGSYRLATSFKAACTYHFLRGQFPDLPLSLVMPWTL